MIIFEKELAYKNDIKYKHKISEQVIDYLDLPT